MKATTEASNIAIPHTTNTLRLSYGPRGNFYKNFKTISGPLRQRGHAGQAKRRTLLLSQHSQLEYMYKYFIMRAASVSLTIPHKKRRAPAVQQGGNTTSSWRGRGGSLPKTTRISSAGA